MKKVFGYIRVSTVKQGEGVSLQEQKGAIMRFAEQNGLLVSKWFEEKETAAKHGRPVFSAMIRALRANKAEGVIIHKIDRSARNLRDWADLGDLIDAGTAVHFAHESIDLTARGGRLSADIQAVIASDYVRNLREECIKGLYGRLKQGIYPFQAPIGYQNKGAGKPKEVNPIMAPLVLKTFELYASGKYSIKSLLPVAHKFGLRNSKGNKINKNGLSLILNNPFYIGLMQVKGSIYQGNHEPIVPVRLYKKVQEVLKGRYRNKVTAHSHLFRRLIKCYGCGYSLIGEIQKGHVYYRCHTSGCPTKGLREDRIQKYIQNALSVLKLNPREKSMLEQMCLEEHNNQTLNVTNQKQSLNLRLVRTQNQLHRLTDLYLDEEIEKDLFESRKRDFLTTQQDIRDKLAGLDVKNDSDAVCLEKNLELAMAPEKLYYFADQEEKRELLKTITSNLSVEGKKLYISMRSPFHEIANRTKLQSSPLERDTPRKKDSKIDNPATFIFSDPNTSAIKEAPLNSFQLKGLFETLKLVSISQVISDTA